MKFFNLTALSAILAAWTAIAGSHASDDTKQSSSMSDAKTTQTESTGKPVSAACVQGNNTPERSRNGAEIIRTRDIIGGAIYTMNEASDEGWQGITYTEINPGWNDIGEIHDVVLSRSGQMEGVIAKIGGILDIADAHVLMPIAEINLVPVDASRYAIVTRFNEEQLEDLENLDESTWY